MVKSAPLFIEGEKMGNKKKFSLSQKQNISGWIFLTPATLLIAIMSFYPMIRAIILSMQTGVGAKISFAGLNNYKRMFSDAVFMQSLKNTFIYLIVQVPIMLLFALLLASLLNDKHLRFKGLFRTCIFLPCATSLVSYAIIFRSLFAVDGYVNTAHRIQLFVKSLYRENRNYYRTTLEMDRL